MKEPFRHLLTIMILCLAVKSIFLKGAFSEQPYRNHFENFFVRQGPGQCGPASFYMIFKYYGDDRRGPGFFYIRDYNEERSGGYRSLDLAQIIPGKEFSKLTKETEIAKWINGGKGSTDWDELTQCVRNLYVKGAGISYQRYYTVIDEGGAVVNNKKGKVERKRRFVGEIYHKYLKNNRPVLVHLKRIWPLPGHYLVIAGFEEDRGMVKFVDPNTEYNGNIIQEISLDAFLLEKWFRSPGYPWWYPAAGWDGKWLGFFRE